MNDPRDIRPDLEPDTPDDEARVLQSVADQLADERPVPAAGFRAQLRRSLIDQGGATITPRPARLRVAILAYASSGALLLLVAAVGLVGVGPFAA